MIRILELLLCLILRTLDLLSGRPPNRNEDDEEEQHDEVTRIINRNKPQEQKEKSNNSNKNLVVLSEEVSTLINSIMETNKATQEVDMKEISRLRSEIAKLQQELIVAKADNSKLRSMMKDKNKKGGDAEDG